MRTLTFASTARAVRLTTSPRNVPDAAPGASELTEPTVTPGAAKAGLAPDASSATPPSATPAARTMLLCIDPPFQTLADATNPRPNEVTLPDDRPESMRSSV